MKARRSKLAPAPPSAAPAVGQPLRRARFHYLGVVVIAAAAWEAAPTTIAADGFWLGNAGSWGDPAIWLGETPADGADSTAFFTGINITANRTITLDTPRTIGNIAFSDATNASNDLTINGTNNLTLDVTTGIPTVNVTNQTLTISSTIAGNDGLIKDGAGLLILSSNNTFTGGLFIKNGTVNAPAGAVSNLGADLVIMGGPGSSGAALTSNKIVNNSFVIRAPDSGIVSVGSYGFGPGSQFTGGFLLDGNLILNNEGSTSGTMAITGGVSGIGSLTINNAGSASVIVSGDVIDPTGSITVQGASTGTSTITAAIGTNVTGITKNSAGPLNLIGANSYKGSTVINTGTVTLGSTDALGNTSAISLAAGATLASTFDGISIRAPITLGNNSSGTATIIAPNDGGGGSATRTLTLDGVIGGAGNLTLGANATINANPAIVLNAANTYRGTTTLTTSNTSAALITRLGTANALPVTTVVTINGGNGSGSGKLIALDLNGFDQTLAGLTNTTGLYSRWQRIYNTSSAAATLIVNNNFSYTFSGQIGVSGANLGLTKTGTGSLTLGGSNGYTGPTIVNGGRLVLDFSLFADSLTNAPANYINPNSVLTLGGSTFSVTGRPNGSAVSSTPWNATAPNSAKILFSTLPPGIVVGQSISTSVTGTTYVVAIDAPIKGLVLSSNMSGSTGTFATAATTVITRQSFNNGTTLNAGASTLSINANGGAGTVVSLGPITRNPGATVNFTQPAGTLSASNGFTTTTPNNAGAILGGWATVGGTDWAVQNGTNIVAADAGIYTVTSIAGTTPANYANAHIDVNNSPGLPGGVIAPRTLRFNTAASNTLTLAPGDNTIISDGILVTGTVSSNLSTITGGRLRASPGGELMIFQNNPGGGLTIESIIADHTTATGLIKSGPGTLTLVGNNLYTGPTRLSGGTLSVGTAANLGGTGSELIFDGGTLQVTGTALTSFSGIGHPVSFGPDRTVGLDIQDPLNTFTVDQVLNQAGGGFNKLGAGTAIINQTTTYTGPTRIAAGTLNITSNRTAPLSTTPGLGIDVGGPGAVLNLSGDFPLGALLFRVGNANGPGTVYQTAGTVSFSVPFLSGDALTVGAAAPGGKTGTYNLSGGTLMFDAPGSRGIAIGATGVASGTFNLSGTGTLIMTGSSFLQIGRSNNIAGNPSQAGIFNQTGGHSTVGELRMGGQGSITEANSIAQLNLSAGTFSAASFTILSSGNGSSSTLSISGTADVTLPAFPVARGNNATAVITFDGGTLKPAAASASYMGGLTNAFIKAAGAVIDTTKGEVTITQDLVTDAGSTGGGLTKAGGNTLTLTGRNTWSGHTTVTGGTLSLAHPNPNNDRSTVTIATGATLQLAFVGTDTVGQLVLGGIQRPAGIYGHTNSGATNGGLGVGALDTWFAAGTGRLSVTGIHTGGGGYAGWKTAHANGQGVDLDWDMDGVGNGVEYFMNASAGFTTLPTLNASHTITWPNGGNIPASAYGNQFVVQTSGDLMTWTDVPAGSLTTNTDGPGGSLTYTLPAGGPPFVRLKVTPE